MKKGRRFQSIKAWQLADELAVETYEATKALPKEELYGMSSQMRRSCVSVAANIAEGSSRTSSKEYLQFLSIARGSLAELRYYFHLAARLKYLNECEKTSLDDLGDETARVLYGLMQFIHQTNKSETRARSGA